MQAPKAPRAVTANIQSVAAMETALEKNRSLTDRIADDREQIVKSSISASQPNVEPATDGEEQDDIAPRTYPLVVKERKLQLYFSFGVLNEAIRIGTSRRSAAREITFMRIRITTS